MDDEERSGGHTGPTQRMEHWWPWSSAPRVLQKRSQYHLLSDAPEKATSPFTTQNTDPVTSILFHGIIKLVEGKSRCKQCIFLAGDIISLVEFGRTIYDRMSRQSLKKQRADIGVISVPPEQTSLWIPFDLYILKRRGC